MFGAQAVNLHGFPRTTADLDITVDVSDRNLRELLRKLASAGFSPRFSDEAFIRATRVIPVVHDATAMPIDLVLAGPGLEQRFLAEVELRTIAKRKVPVLTAEHLVVTKLLAGRPKDLQDVRELIAMRPLDHRTINALLAELEEALGQSDLLPLYERLRSESQS